MIRTYKEAVCLITGGASGIGRALANELTRRDATVILADRQEDEVRAVAHEIEAKGGKANATTLDVRDAQAFEEVVGSVMKEHGRIDYFFNNAGIGIGGGFEDHTLDDWRYIVDVNLMGVIYGAHSIYPRMQEQGFGHIVNTASMAGQIGTPALSAYGTTKHAVVGLTRSLRTEAAPHGVRVSAFCPGPIRTAILEKGGKFGRMRGWAGVFETESAEDARAMDVEKFATQALDELARNRGIIILPRIWRALRWIDRLLPEKLNDRFQAFTFRRMRQEMEKRAAKAKRKD